ncbi:hypothetical protein BASA82_000154 [Batrachochytrium salamandrivorans]|nr:hypothetical protein BASA82_000154 [Batrachochytrium salamandrivorans]
MKPAGFKVEIKKYRATGVWKMGRPALQVRVKNRNTTLMEESEDCGICRQAFDATCPDCLLPGEDCPPVRGNCSHMYHMHCIVKWCNAQMNKLSNVPCAAQPWKF